MTVLRTKEGNCGDCYRCLRYCPLKAIKVEHDKAQVIPSECIDDGLCSLSCPNGTSEIVNQWDRFSSWMLAKEAIQVSLGPSYLGLGDDPNQLIGALLRLGVSRVEEAAWVLPPISAAYWQLKDLQPAITSACPALIRLVEVHFPNLVKHLAPVLSPMVLHGRSLKERYPQAKVVYIGACPARKGEREQFRDDVDLVLTFHEVFQGLRNKGVRLDSEIGTPPQVRASTNSRRFALEGGWRNTWGGSDLNTRAWAISGFNECIQFLTALQENKIDCDWAEMMICPGGCIGGAGWDCREDGFLRQSRLMSRLISHREGERPREPNLPLARQFSPNPAPQVKADPQEVQKVLKTGGKARAEDRLNCGACGYNSCLDLATAVVLNKAEASMCVPHMRIKAESMANVIIKAIPDGIITVSKDLRIVAINPSAETMFQCRQNALLGKHLQVLMDPVHFVLARNRQKPTTANVFYNEHQLFTRQIIFPVENQEIIIGIFVDISREQRHNQELAHLKAETISKAKEVINKQMRVAQEIAGLLGETTGETKLLLSRLIELMEEEGHPPAAKGGDYPASGKSLG